MKKKSLCQQNYCALHQKMNLQNGKNRWWQKTTWNQRKKKNNLVCKWEGIKPGKSEQWHMLIMQMSTKPNVTISSSNIDNTQKLKTNFEDSRNIIKGKKLCKNDSNNKDIKKLAFSIKKDGKELEEKKGNKPYWLFIFLFSPMFSFLSHTWNLNLEMTSLNLWRSIQKIHSSNTHTHKITIKITLISNCGKSPDKKN